MKKIFAFILLMILVAVPLWGATQDFKGTVNGVTINATTIGPFTKDAAGQVTNPTQPAFLAYNSVTDADATGDGTVYTVVCDTEVYDQNADYNNGTGVFTAPVTGKYLLIAAIRMQELANNNASNYIATVTTARTYKQGSETISATGNIYGAIGLQVSAIADMAAGETAYIIAQGADGSKVIDVYGGATLWTFFSGALLN